MLSAPPRPSRSSLSYDCRWLPRPCSRNLPPPTVFAAPTSERLPPRSSLRQPSLSMRSVGQPRPRRLPPAGLHPAFIPTPSSTRTMPANRAVYHAGIILSESFADRGEDISNTRFPWRNDATQRRAQWCERGDLNPHALRHRILSSFPTCALLITKSLKRRQPPCSKAFWRLAQYLDCHLRREVARSSATEPPQKDRRLSTWATDDTSGAVHFLLHWHGFLAVCGATVAEA